MQPNHPTQKRRKKDKNPAHRSLTRTEIIRLPLLPSGPDGVGRRLLARDPRVGTGKRSERDSNPRYPVRVHTLSKRTPSATRSPLHSKRQGFGLQAAASMPPRSLPAASSRLIRPTGRRSLGSNPRAVPSGILGHSPNPYNLIRRDRDSNPGCRRPTQRISNPPDSTTLAPLHLYALEDSNLRPLGPQPNALSS